MQTAKASKISGGTRTAASVAQRIRAITTIVIVLCVIELQFSLSLPLPLCLLLSY